MESGALVYLDATSLTVRIVRGSGADAETTEIPLSLPPPFGSGWDVWEFAPVSESVFVFTLVDDALYGFKDGVVRRLEEADVDLLRPSGESVLLRSRSFDGKKLLSTALKRVNADLKVETLWKSKAEDPSWYPPALSGVWGPVSKVMPQPPNLMEPSCEDLSRTSASGPRGNS